MPEVTAFLFLEDLAKSGKIILDSRALIRDDSSRRCVPRPVGAARREAGTDGPAAAADARREARRQCRSKAEKTVHSPLLL